MKQTHTRTLRRRRRTIDDTLRLNLAVQRRTIEHLSEGINQVQADADRLYSAVTGLEGQLADLEKEVRELRKSHAL